MIASDKRSALVRKNIIASFILKIWSAAIVFLSVPLTLKCLGAYSNGVWLTISSMLIWIEQMDIGLGNGMRNRLAENIARNDKTEARKTVTSVFAMMIVVMVPISIVLLTATLTTDVYAWFNIDNSLIPDLRLTIFLALALFIPTIVLKIVGNIYMAFQLPAVSNLLLALGQTMALGITFAIYLTGNGSLTSIVAANTAAPLAVYGVAFPLTLYKRYDFLSPKRKSIDTKVSLSLISKGMQFFVIQISGAVLFLSSNLVISQMLSPESVTVYQIAYRYFTIPLIIFTIICTPYWSATTDAFARNDIAWIRECNKKLNIYVGGIIAVIIAMVAVSKQFYTIWIGSDMIPFNISVLMALYLSITIISLRYSYILNGLSALKVQLVFTLTAACLFIPAAYWATTTFHSLESMLCTLCVINVPGLIANYIQYKRITDDHS